MEIELHFDRKDFEEIYARENRLSYFKSAETKTTLVDLTLGLVLVFAVLFLFWDRENWGYLVVIGILIMYLSIRYLKAASQIRKKRKEITTYLNEIAAYDRYRLVLTNESFTLLLDEEEHKEYWSDFTNCHKHPLFLLLSTKKEHYLIPKKSLTQPDLEQLTRMLADKNILNSVTKS